MAVNVAFFEWKKLENRPFTEAQISKMKGTLTVKDVSLFQLLSSGSLAKSPEGGKTEQLFLHRFITFVILSKSRANI